MVANTTTNATFFNVTGLLPGTTYELTVVAVSQGGDIIVESQPSNSLQVITTVTGSLIKFYVCTQYAAMLINVDLYNIIVN